MTRGMPSTTSRRPTAHVDMLPVEILRKIFLATYPIKFFVPHAIARISYAETVLYPSRLSHVSRRWREVAISFGELWSYLYLRLRDEDTWRIGVFSEVFSKFLERTRSSPINFSVDFVFHNLLNEQARRAVQDMISALLQKQNQWKNVFFMWHNIKVSQRIQRLSISNMPHVRSLYLNVWLKKHDGSAYLAEINISQSSLIKDINLVGSFHLEDRGPQKYMLRRCALRPINELSDGAAARMCISILAHAPNLRDMQFSSENTTTQPGTHTSAAPVRHSRPIETLTLCRWITSPSDAVLDSLSLPRLRQLCYLDNSTTSAGSALLRLMRSSPRPPPMTKLAIQSTSIHVDVMIEVLLLAPALEELDMRRYPASTHLFGALNARTVQGEYMVCPKLEVIYLSGQWLAAFDDAFRQSVAAALVSMVSSRLRITRKLNAVVNLASQQLGREKEALGNEYGYSILKEWFRSGVPIAITTD